MSTTTSATAIAAEPADPRVARRVVWASFVGTALESYDFYIYAYFAAFFVGPLFFDPLGTVGGTLAAFATIGIAFVVRPIGAVVFGHLGDRIGRRRTLLITIGLMGVATGLIGMLPTYAMAGWIGAVLLVVLRLLQGLSLGGEWGGSILLATEHAGERRRAFYAALPQLGSPVGSILSAALFLFLTATMYDELLVWAWRIPFLTAIPLLLVSLYLRWSIDETPVFRAVVENGKKAKAPLLDVLRRQPAAVALATSAAFLGIGSYSLMNTYTLNYGAATLGFSYTELLIAVTVGGLLQLVTIPLFGRLAMRVGSAKVVAWGAAGTLLITFPMYWLIQFSSFPVLVGMMIVGGILPTMSWAALGGLMSDLFAGRYRYTALSFAYSLAAVVGGFIPLATTGLGEASSFAWWHPGIVLAILSIVTLVASVLASRRPRAALGEL